MLLGARQGVPQTYIPLRTLSLASILATRLWAVLALGAKMRRGAGPLLVMAAVFWTQCVLLQGVDAKKERKKAKEATPQRTEALNATVSNSEEVGASIKVGTHATHIPDFASCSSGSEEPSRSHEPRRERLQQMLSKWAEAGQVTPGSDLRPRRERVRQTDAVTVATPERAAAAGDV